MAVKIGKKEWIGLYIVTGIVDVTQWVLDCFVVTSPINEIADPFIGVAIAGYLQFRGVSMIKNWKRLGSLVAALGLAELTVSIAPAWIADIWYIHSDVRKEEAEEAAAKEQEQMLSNSTRQPKYVGGVRQPDNESGNEGSLPLGPEFDSTNPEARPRSPLNEIRQTNNVKPPAGPPANINGIRRAGAVRV